MLKYVEVLKKCMPRGDRHCRKRGRAVIFFVACRATRWYTFDQMAATSKEKGEFHHEIQREGACALCADLLVRVFAGSGGGTGANGFPD
jgi:hypothetical protein